VSAIWLAGVSGLDRALLERLAWPDKHPRSDLLMLLRIWGSIWTWSLIALAMGLQKQLSGAVRGVHARLARLLLLAPPCWPALWRS
jgi:hypothetical protein